MHRSAEIGVLVAGRCSIHGLFEDALVLGSLPGAFVEGAGFRTALAAYGEVYIEEEVLREMATRNLGAYGRFLELAAIESGKPVNLTRLSQESGIALSTIRGFYSVLEDTLLGFSLGPYSGSPRTRILKTPKFYFSTSAFVMRLRGCRCRRQCWRPKGRIYSSIGSPVNSPPASVTSAGPGG